MNTLLISRINQKAPYEVKLSRNGFFYVFQTEQNTSYSISFSEEYEIGGCMGYQFSIDNVDHAHGSYSKVENTNFYMAIIVENNNPKLEDITLDFSTTANALSK